MNRTINALMAGLLSSVALIAHAAAPAWQEGQSYSNGATVSYAGHDYQALVAHTAFVGAGWTPTAAPTLWRDLGKSDGNLPSITPTSAPIPTPTPVTTSKPTQAPSTTPIVGTPTSAPIPTPTPVSTSKPTQTPSATPIVGTPAPGLCWSAWQSGVAYTAGQRVSFEGVNYEAKWWSNTAPTQQEWGSWKKIGDCHLNQTTPTPSPSAAPTIPAQGLLFDDFNYSHVNQLANHGWQVRSWDGGPGFANGNWSPDNLSFVADPNNPANILLRMKAKTNVDGSTVDGNKLSSGKVSQAELSTQDAIYLNGTWAARMHFSDQPISGPDGDVVVNAFFGITKYIEGAEPYSEIDFEYLPNGGWSKAGPTMWSGTYEIAAYDSINHPTATLERSFQGWHTLLMNVSDGYIRFYVDGELMQDYSGLAQPDHPMYLALQLWMTNAQQNDGSPGLLRSTEWREYQQDVDWVLYLKDQQLKQTEVDLLVANLRSKNLNFIKNIK